MTLPGTVSTLLRTRRIPFVPMALVDKQLDRIANRRRQHKSVDADLATLRMLRNVQLKAATRSRKGGHHAQA